MKKLSVHIIHAETVKRTACSFPAERMPARYEKAMRYRLERDRLLCLGAGLLLMNVLGIHDEKEILYGPYGKPYVPGKPAFSISHSGSLCILAVGDVSLLGADIEEIDERHIDIAKEVFTENELAWMAEEPAERFFRLWTLKECVMKATGLGMDLAPKSFEVLPLVKEEPLSIMGRKLYSRGKKLGQSYLSVCADEPIRQVVFDLKE